MFKRRVLARLLVAAGLLLAPAVGLAHEFKVGAITVAHPWSRATPPAAKVAGGYLGLTNTGAEDDRLVSVTSPVSPDVQIHEMKLDNGVMTMRQLPDGLAIPAGKSVALEPGGAHLMLTGLTAPFKQGDKVPLRLTFAKAGSVDVWLQVDAMGASTPAAAAAAHDHQEHGAAH